MNSKIHIIIILLLAVITCGLAYYVTQTNSNKTINNDSPITDNEQVTTPTYELQNVYITKGTGRDLYAVGSNQISKPLIGLIFSNNDYTELYVNGDYTVTIYLKGAHLGVYENYYVVTEYYTSVKYQNAIEVLYELPSD